MNTLNLTPVDNNYLTSNILYRQLIQNADNLTVDTDNFTVSVQPQACTYGNGTVQLTGSVVAAGSPAANYAIATLPNWCVPTQDDVYNVAVLRDGAFVSNAVKVNTSGDSIARITVTNAGSYETLPTVAITGPGAGAVLSTTMKAVSATVAAPGTTYAPGDTITWTGGTATVETQVSVTSTQLISVAANVAGTGYVPNEILTLVGGTATTAATVTIATTKVFSATVAQAGSGGTDGTQTVTGTTGTGTKFQASVTIASGGITAVNSITVGGAYTVNPTSLTNEPVTGASLTGAQLNVVMGVNAVTLTTGGTYTANSTTFTCTGGSGAGATFNTGVFGVRAVTVGTTPGAYSALPTSPVAQGSTSGVGTGATFNALWGIAAIKLSASGSGYTSASAVSITGGGGTGGGAASITLDSSIVLELVNAPTVGDIVYLSGISFIVNSYNSQ